MGHLLPVTYFLVTISFYLKTYDSAQIKITLTHIGCSLVSVLWVAQLFLERRWPLKKKDLPVAAPLLAFMASGAFSMATSSFPAGSMDEGFRRILYSFMGLIALLEFRGRDRLRRLLRWLLAAFVVVVGYGLIQYFDTRLFSPGGPGLDPFVWRQAFGARVFSSFGNPNFYGNFLVIITPILLSMYFRSGGGFFRPYLLLSLLIPMVVLADKIWLGGFGGVDASTRWPMSAGLLLLAALAAVLVFYRTPSGTASGMLIFFGAMFVTLFATETKGAWIGFLGSLIGTSILAGLFLTGASARKMTRRLLMAAAVTGVLGVGVVGYFARQRIQSVSFRVFTWISTWEMIREKPLLGTGIGSFKWAYPAYRRPEIILLEGKSNTETDHAEEEYLEVWYDEGLVGLGFFLWLIFTVSFSGLRGLGALTHPSVSSQDRERIHGLVAYLGAWWGALVHWLMDVSVRFVSSGVYSLFLPGLVLGLVRSDVLEERQDPPVAWEAKIRAVTALFWTVVFLSLQPFYRSLPFLEQAWSPLLLGFLLWVLGEILEMGLSKAAVDFSAVAVRPPSSPAAVSVAFLLLGLWAGFLFPSLRNFFKADLHHNIAIFFSKSGIWSKGAEFDDAKDRLPLPMREEYDKVGGALEHYSRVNELNPHFPMAGYFIGNVYNDWGSMMVSRAVESRRKGDSSAEASFVQKARTYWDKSLSTYSEVKAFAPNYVQTHHQVGLLYLKTMELENLLNRPEEGRKAGDLALENFSRYRALDPVFPQNYYHPARILIQRDELDRAEELLRGALTYNTKNVVNRVYPDRNAETYLQIGRLLLHRLGKTPTGERGPISLRAREAFEEALAQAQKMPEGQERRQRLSEIQQGLGILQAGGSRLPSAS
jgi:tetratricopeptide (TPR) repeat protein/O-antigen ligase